MFRVCTYNVLSSSLTSSPLFNFCEADALEESIRYKKILKIVESEVEKQSVICLQEVSQLWASRLHAYFAERGYYFVHHGYGSLSNGFMGVGVAFSLKKFKLAGAEVRKVHHLKSAPPEKRPRRTELTRIREDPSLLRFVLSLCVILAAILSNIFPSLEGQSVWLTVVLSLLTYIVFDKIDVNSKPQSRDKSRWQPLTAKEKLDVKIKEESEKRWKSLRSSTNVYVAVKLQIKEFEFIVCTYHVPSVQDELEKLLHLVLVANTLKLESCPYVLAGDFAIQPGDLVYRFLTSKIIENTLLNKFLPEYEEDQWSLALSEPVFSAYKEVEGVEPETTNICNNILTADISHKTLDYIFYSSGLKATLVESLPLRKSFTRPVPSYTCPSDHLKLAAEFVQREAGNDEIN